MTRRRRLLAAGTALAALCLGGLAAAVAVLRSGWFNEQVRLRIIREVESATGGRAEIGGFAFSWERMRAEVRSFVLHGAEPEGDPPLFSAASVRLGLKPVSILRRDVDIQSLVVGEPRLRIAVYPDGTTNLPQPPAARRRERPVEPFLALAIEDFRIEGGLIEINDRRTPLDVAGEDFSSRLEYQTSGPRYDGVVSFRRLRVASSPWFAAALDADIALSLEAGRLVLKDARFRTQRSTARLDGAVENLLSPRVSAGVEARISLEEAQALAGRPAIARGTVDLSGLLAYASRSDFSLSGRIAGSGLSAAQAGVTASGIGLASALRLSPDGVELSGLSLSALGGAFRGSAGLDKQRRFRLDGTAELLLLSELARLGSLKPLPWDGRISGPLAAEGVLDGGVRGAKLAGRFDVEPADPARPLLGRLDLALDQGAGSLVFNDSRLATAASSVRFSGDPRERLQVELESTDLDDLLPALAYVSPPGLQSLPLAIKGGPARFKGMVEGATRDARLSGHVSVGAFVCGSHAVDWLEADVAASQSGLEAARVLVRQGEGRLQGQGRLELAGWRAAPSGRVSGSFELSGLTLDRIAAGFGRKIPVSGVAAGRLQLAGTLRRPELAANLSVVKASAFGQSADQLRVRGRYASNSLAVESLEADINGARLRASGVFSHREGDWTSGALRAEVSGSGLRLSRIAAAARLPEQLDGTLDLDLKGAASVEQSRFRLTQILGNASVRKATWEGKAAGGLQAAGKSDAGELALSASGNLLGSKIEVQGRCTLDGKYPFRGELGFSRNSLSNLWPWLSKDGDALPPVEVSASGRAYFRGDALEPDSWNARVEMPGVEVVLPPEAKPLAPGLRNAGLVVAAVTRKSVRVISARFAGPDTNLGVTGGVDLATRLNAYDLRVRGSVNLGALRRFDPNLTASGESQVDATIRGPRSRPEFHGRLEFKQASLFLSNIPNGLEDASGVVLLFRDRATIESITASTGGGKLSLKGFAGFGAGQTSYGLAASARNVRIRYPAGVSTSVDAELTLTGTSSRSLVGGKVTILRSGVAPEVDLAALLSRAAQPVVTPAIHNELLRGMQFDVQVEAAPNARFDTMLTRDIRAEAALRVRGTPYKPILLGRILVNQGQVNFLGNRYTISRGEISFLNPVRLEPVLNLNLETRVQGVDVTLSFTGPADRLSLGYRSDPPLQMQEIIALLAVGRAPTSDAALLARRSERDQSWSQLGASTLVGQALDAAVTSRVQRFFGVSRIKIDPRLTGLANKPEAQLTLEQQISRDLTLTYVTSLAQEQQQLVRVEWNVSRQWSLLAVREGNGLFGVEVQFRRQFK